MRDRLRLLLEARRHCPSSVRGDRKSTTFVELHSTLRRTDQDCLARHDTIRHRARVPASPEQQSQ